MSLTLLTPPSAEPTSLDDLKAHLRVDGEAEDALIIGLAVAARQTIEARCGLAFLNQGWRLTLDRVPDGMFELPLSPVASIHAVRLFGADGEEQTLSPSDYDAALGRPGRIRLRRRGAPTYGLSTDGRSTGGFGSFVIDFTAGWPSPAEAPADLRLAVKILTAHYYENREQASTERFYAMPEGVAALIAPWRRVRL